MRVISAEVHNFASYKHLIFNFNKGLTLIQGANGAGKSTLCDIIPWILFGVTAKGGKVDEIRSWNSEGNTSGTIRFDSGLSITRTRSPNDLYYRLPTSYDLDSNTYNDASRLRGKDLGDTQKLINNLIKVDIDLYLSGAYFHEFSQTAQFFTATPKIRRQTCEQLVDLSLPIKLQDKIGLENKEINRKIQDLQQDLNDNKNKISMLERLQISENNKAKEWDTNQELSISQLKQSYDRYEVSRIQAAKDNKCRECGTVLGHTAEKHNTSPNPYTTQLELFIGRKNPHTGTVKDYTNEINTLKDRLYAANTVLDLCMQERSDLETLSEVTASFRSELVKNTISFIENQTNELLSKYFDNEVNIELQVIENDKLDVIINKDGNIASFTQLSKGQRQLLKLCFGVSVMKTVSNHHGVDFNCIFFDESLDGLSDIMKTKAFHLFESLQLSHDSVYIVDHSEGLKVLFENQLTVELKNGNSELCQN